MKWDGDELVEARPLRQPGRRQPGRPDGPRRPAPPPRRARRDRRRSRSPGRRRSRGSSRARATSATSSCSGSGSRRSASTSRRAAAAAPRPGWNCHQYHANSEFYADWGDYRVAITLPEKFVVGSAGALVDEKKANGRKTLTFEQKSIHDFAFTADPRYVVVGGRLRPGEGHPAGRGRARREDCSGGRRDGLCAPASTRWRSASTCSPTTCDRPDRHIGTRRSGRSRGLASRPSRTPTRRSPSSTRRRTASGAGGMEYQTIYTTFTFKSMARWPLEPDLPSPRSSRSTSSAHGYWYGLLASNEFEESWMDEGINTFTEIVNDGPEVRRSTWRSRPASAATDEDVNRAVAALPAGLRPAS